MFRTVMAFVVLAGLVFGGSTVAVAQSSLPDEALYPVKIWTEDVRISFAGNEEAQFNLTWDFANRRLGEIQTLLNTGAFIPEPVMTRLETQLDDSLTHAANLPDDQAMVALLQVQTQLQQQKQTISQFQFQTEASPAMLQIRERIQNTLELHLGLAQGGAGDPQWLREQLRIRRQEHNNHGEPGGGNPWTTGTPTPGSGYGPGESQNPWTTGTPTPGSGYGPGESQNPWTTGTPTPGSGYGPGPGNNPGSTPPSDGSSDGSGPCDSCGNGSGGNGNKP